MNPSVRARCRSRLSVDDGFSLIELLAALSILSIGFITLASATSGGARLLVQSRQRQVATDEASARLEHSRNIPYNHVALTSTPVHSTDTTNPDHEVSSDGTSYDYRGSGSYEALIISTVAGEVTHYTSPVVVGSTQLTVYQYITWVDDPSITGTQDYKRLVIVVSYQAAGNGGRPHSVQVSALLTNGTVTISGSTPGPTQGSAPPTPVPSVSPPGICAGDLIPPVGDFAISSGTGASVGYTASPAATLTMTLSDPCPAIRIKFSNDGVTYGAAITYDPTTNSVSWNLAAGDGVKTVWAQVSDGAGNTSIKGPHTITLDQALPTVAGVAARIVACLGVNRSTTVSWGASVDANFLGYRLYRSINGAAFVPLLTSSALLATDTQSKTLDSVQYKVVGYDKAGNESTPTNVISLAKNQCA